MKTFFRLPHSQTWHWFRDCSVAPKGKTVEVEVEEGEIPAMGRPCARCWRRERRETGTRLPGYDEQFVMHER